MTAAAWVQAVATVALILVTACYVYHTWRIAQRTGQAADAARESAEAARDLLELERTRMAQAHRPELLLTLPVTANRVDHVDWYVNLHNVGPGPAVKPTLRLHFEGDQFAEDYDVPLSYTIDPGRGERATVQVSPEADRRYAIAVALCHYNSLGEESGVYHSLYIHCHPPHYGPLGPVTEPMQPAQAYCPPDRPLHQDPHFRRYLHLCKACQETEAESHHETSDV